MNAPSARPALRGLYAITPDVSDTAALLVLVEQALAGGAPLVQYRNKTAAPELRREQARGLKHLCDAHSATLIINDHVNLAIEVDAGGVHLGAEDAGLVTARAALGAGKLIGVSCYNRLELARAAAAHGADYVAFGSVFPSRVKPDAVHAPLSLIAAARREISLPIIAIGGITLDNACGVIGAGADMIAVISALFDVPAVSAAARAYSALFTRRSFP